MEAAWALPTCEHAHALISGGCAPSTFKIVKRSLPAGEQIETPLKFKRRV
jgi:hypothetical protein